MKLAATGAVGFALTVSFAVGQPRIERNLMTADEVRHPANESAPQTISVDLLRQPLSRKAKQILAKAQHAADAGDHPHAIGFLEIAHVKYPESDAWTQSMLGVEYLKTQQFSSALLSLEQAVLLLPRDAVDRSNLGFALASTGQYDRAEAELRCALALDHGDPQTRHLLDLVIASVTTKPTPSKPVTATKIVCPQ
jgi:Flp pilus assembly protein TadD